MIVDFHVTCVEHIGRTCARAALVVTKSVLLTPDTVAVCDAILFVAVHSCVELGTVAAQAQLPVDTRDVTAGLTRHKVEW